MRSAYRWPHDYANTVGIQGTLSHLQHRFTRLRLSTAFSGVCAPTTAIHMLSVAFEFVHRFGLSFQYLFAIEWYTEASARTPSDAGATTAHFLGHHVLLHGSDVTLARSLGIHPDGRSARVCVAQAQRRSESCLLFVRPTRSHALFPWTMRLAHRRYAAQGFQFAEQQSSGGVLSRAEVSVRVDGFDADAFYSAYNCRERARLPDPYF